MTKVIRVVEESMMPPALASLLQWHPSYASMNEDGTGPPPCYYEYMAWCQCISGQGPCKIQYDRLVACLVENDLRPKT